MTEEDIDKLAADVHLNILKERVAELRQAEAEFSKAAEGNFHFGEKTSPKPKTGTLFAVHAFTARAYAEALSARVALAQSDDPTKIMEATRSLLDARDQRRKFGILAGTFRDLVDSTECDLKFTLCLAADVARALVGSGREFLREAELRTEETLVDAVALLHQLDGVIAEHSRKTTRPKAKAASANARAMDLLSRDKGFKHLSSGEWAERLGVSDKTVRNTPAWKTLRSKQLRLSRDPRDVAELGDGDVQLARLVDEQAKDARASSRRKRRARN